MGIFDWLRGRQPKPAKIVAPVTRRSFFTTDFDVAPKNKAEEAQRMQRALAITFQRGTESLRAVDSAGQQQVGTTTFAMDEAYPDLAQAKLVSSTPGYLPVAQLEYFAGQGFIGWQTCAILAQNWLIDKACTVPAQDAIRHGWQIATTDGQELSNEVLDDIKRGDKKYQIKRQCREFVKNGRIFGIRHALFLVDGIDYEAPFNPDGVRKGSYRGITQIDPYWISPMLDSRAAANPAAKDFYEPTWWMVNGKRIHKSHFVIMRNGDQVTDILKPSYMYGGIPVPQKIFERVYASEKTANEAPMLAMTKRLTSLKVDMGKALANQEKFNLRMEWWTQLQNNFGVKVIDINDELAQFDTSLTSFDETIMTQYQLVAAAANMPATKLLGTTPKGFNATGEYDESSYHEELESIQEHDLSPLIERHHQLLIRSEIAPRHGMAPFATEVAWNSTDSPTAKEMAEINNKKADTDMKLVTAGAVDGTDVRNRLIQDADSGYNGIEDVVPGGPGDREAQQAAEAALEQPVTAKVTAKNEGQE